METAFFQDSEPKTVDGKEIFGVSVNSYTEIKENIHFDELNPQNWPAQDKVKSGSIFTIDPEERDDTIGEYSHPLEADVFWFPMGLEHPSIKKMRGTEFWVGVGVYNSTTIIGRYDAGRRNIVFEIYRGVRKRNPDPDEENPSILRVSDAQFRILPDPKIASILGKESEYIANKI